MVVAEGVVIDVDIVPAIGIADADFATVDIPFELAVVVVVVAAVDVVVDFVAPASVAVFTLEIHGGAIAVARESVTVADVGIDISRPGAFEGVGFLAILAVTPELFAAGENCGGREGHRYHRQVGKKLLHNRMLLKGSTFISHCKGRYYLHVKQVDFPISA